MISQDQRQARTDVCGVAALLHRGAVVLLLFLFLFVVWVPVAFEFRSEPGTTGLPVDPGFFAWCLAIYQSGAWLLSLASVSLAVLVFWFSKRWRRARVWTLLPLAVLTHGLLLTLRPVFDDDYSGVAPADLSSKLPDSPGSIRVLHANIYRFNDANGLKEIIRSAREMDPDIVVLHELEREHLKTIDLPGENSDLPAGHPGGDTESPFQWLKSEYPYRVTNTNHPYFGYGVFSRYPLGNVRQISTRLEALVSMDVRCAAQTESLRAGQSDAPICRAGRTRDFLFRLISSHPVAPFNPRILGVHRRALNNLATAIEGSVFADKEETGNAGYSDMGEGFARVLVTGDFNSVDWSADMHELHRRTGLRRLRPSGFLEYLCRGTFPSKWPTFLRIPIDGFYVSEGLKPLGYSVVSVPGSDHLGLILDFEIKNLTGESASNEK